ncbi:MAG TPA: hypothetical protein VKT28_11695 [Puia sp.]|nr:hypothetical protein [Puia sp.]
MKLKLNKLKYYLILPASIAITFFHTADVLAQNNSIGIFDGQTDVGNPVIKGSTVFDNKTQYYSVTGSGSNIWADHDQFHFVWKKIKGDFILRANAAFLGKGIEDHRKIGWMIRSSLDSSSPHVNAVVHGDGLTSLQFRRTIKGTTEEIKSSITGADIIQLERRGNIYIMSVARKGDLFVKNEVADINLGDDVYVGIFVCSHNASVSERALFNNVRIVVPPKKGYVAYKDYIGSAIEILNIEDDNCRVVYQSPKSLQAPNWMKDDGSLLYNSEGLLYKFNLAMHQPELMNTGSAKSNNNDHVISFDGKMLTISSQSAADKGGSIGYTVPIEGGEPKRITETAPSYMHGWSPDGKDLVFTGQRNNDFDVYKISSSGGKEIRLTDAPGLDDGPEYTPDGKYIYFNSVRSGMMQIWRMKPDGSDQERITNDSLNDWFPHISPDGKWIVFISFNTDVSPGDHPFYKHVYLRMMPASGGTPKVIAYLYGGQGTINTPSWSPDSKHIAFVSNSQLLFDIFPKEK